MKLERTQLRLLLIVGGMMVLFIFALWLPHHLRTGRITQRIADAEQRLSLEQHSAHGQLSQLSREVNRLQSVLSHNERYIPEHSEWAALHRQITESLADQQVASPEISTKPVVEGVDFTMIPLTIRFDADFPAVFRVLKQIEASPRLVRVTRVDVEHTPEAVMGQVRVRMELASFFTGRGATE